MKETETRKSQFLSNATAARLPVQQPKTRSAYAARSHYGVLGFIYYAYVIVSSIENLFF